jgi:hypothetical protein
LTTFRNGTTPCELAVGALDVGAERAHRRPVVAEAAGELGQHRVVADRAVNAVQVVRHRGEVAGRQLRAQRAGVEQRRRGAHVIEGRQQLVELDGPGVLVGLFHGEAHRDAHEEDLRQLDAHVVAVDEVAVVQRLQAEVGELQVALGQQRLAQSLQVEAGEVGCQQFELDAFGDVGRQRLGVQRAHVVLGGAVGHAEEAQRFGAQVVAQQAGGDEGVIGLLFDHRAGGDHQRGAEFAWLTPS